MEFSQRRLSRKNKSNRTRNDRDFCTAIPDFHEAQMKDILQTLCL
jgi:hypothetical protein